MPELDHRVTNHVTSSIACFLLVCACALPGGNAAPEERYALSGETVTDRATGLVWQRAVSAQTFSWTAAVEYCRGLNLGTEPTGWRMPTKPELETLVDADAGEPAIDVAAFPDTPADFFWSASFDATEADIWVVDFTFGFSFHDMARSSHYVRCVR